MKTVISSILVVSLVTIAAEARRGEGAAPRNQNRENMQQNRIKQGIKSGELTAREALKLKKGQKKVDRMQNKALEDGNLTPEEKMRIEKAQDLQSKRIYKQKHDKQERKDGKAKGGEAGQTEGSPESVEDNQ